jgi:hypothetical protein
LSLGFFCLMLLVSTLCVAALADRSLVSDSKIMKDHTHAFDSYTRLVVIGVASSVGFGTVLAYVYYPPAPTLLRDIAAVRTELYENVIQEDRVACHQRILR